MHTVRHALAALVVLAAPVLAGCVTDPVTGSSRVGVPISDAEEKALGLNYQPVIRHQFGGAYPDAAAQSHLSKIVLGMAGTSARPQLDWEFTLLNSSVPNAFAVPGGKVFMTRGLLWRMDDEAEFAVVMGHEIGHVEHLHASRAMGKNVFLQILTGAGAVLGGEAVGDLLGAGTGLVSLRYSRDHERESDVRGVEHAYAHGYDPREGADVFREFQRIKEEAGGGGSAMDAWTSSHPLDSERIAAIERLAAEKDARLAGDAPVAGLRVTTPAYANLIRKLRAEQKVYERYDEALEQAAEAAKAKREAGVRAAVPAVEGCARDLPGHAVFEDGLGRLHLVLDDRDRARRHFERAAGMNQGLVLPEYFLSAIALDAEQWGEAQRRSERALGLLPDNYPSLYVHGEALWAQGRRQEAESDFRKVMESAPKESEEYKGAAQRLGTQAAAASGTPAEAAQPATEPAEPRSRKGRRKNRR